MYGYQHRYHAGNLSDLHKHLILLAILKLLATKKTPYCVLDAFAGEGLYDLAAPESQKNKEYLHGLLHFNNIPNKPKLFHELLEIKQSYQLQYKKNIYPGSPAIIKSQLRQDDHAILVENHPHAYLHLKNNFFNLPNIHIHKRDSFEALNALIPFTQKTGLIFIDPSYEIKNDYKNITNVMHKIYKKFSHGIYCIWYPLLKGQNNHSYMLAELKKMFTQTWQHQLLCPPDNKLSLYGSGIIIINPPQQFDQTIKDSLSFLHEQLKPNN